MASINDKCIERTMGMIKQATSLLKQAYFRGYKDGEKAEHDRKEQKMKTYHVECANGKPCRSIIIHESEVINIDLNRNWEITEVDYPDVMRGQPIKKLKVTFEVKEESNG